MDAAEETKVWRKCCFCFPLRKGLLFLVYLNVFVEVLALLIDFLPLPVEYFSLKRIVFYATGSDDNFSVYLLWELPTFVDIAFGIILLYAIHKNNVMLMYAYIWYGSTYCILVVYVGFATMHQFLDYMELLAAVVVGVFYQGYLTLLVRSLRLEIIATNKASYSLKQTPVDDIESQPLPTAPLAHKDSTTDNTDL